jgi:3-oxoacyl-[acyl-carrier protein] reductase
MTTHDKVILISGGSRGLGQALVTAFLAQGDRVATFSRSESPFVAQCRTNDPNGESFHWQAVDAMDPEQIKAYAKSIIRRYGRIDVLINNAAMVTENILTMRSTESISREIRLNLDANVHLTQTCLKGMLMERSGCIINISSVNGTRGNAGLAVYSATKAALDGMTRSLAREMGPEGIRVNSVAPGYFESEMTKDLLSQSKTERIVRRTPLGRLGTSQDIVGLVRFLASSEASFITGQTIVVDGGLSS